MGVSVSKTKTLHPHSTPNKCVIEEHQHMVSNKNARPQYADEKLSYENLQFHENFDTAGGFGSETLVTFITSGNNTYKGHTNALAKNVTGVNDEIMKIMSEFHHRNICPYLGFCQNGSVIVALLPNVDNGSVRDYMSDVSKSLPETLINKWVKESAAGLHFLHAYQCPHGNLNANNCLLFKDNTLKLSDYGVSPRASREDGHPVTARDIGESIRYTAPELLLVRHETALDIVLEQVDIYAYGMLVMEICTRKPPFYGTEMEEIISLVTSGKNPTLPDDLSEDLRGIVQRCWNADPIARPSSQVLVEELCNWSLERDILPEDKDSKPLKANRVACCPSNGKLMVGGWYDNIFLLDGNGMQSSTLQSPNGNDVKPLGRVEGIAITQGHTFVVDGTKYVKVFDSNNKYLDYFSTFTDEENPNLHTDLRCITTNGDGKILVGDCSRKVITTHTCPDGKVESRVKYDMTHTAHMCVNSKNQILCHFRPDDSDLTKVAVINESTGCEMFTFTPRTGEELGGKKVRPRGIVCDTDDNIYVAMCISGTSNNGHIHKYSKTGAFLQCIAKAVYLPMDLDITRDRSLVVANKRSLRIYSLM